MKLFFVYPAKAYLCDMPRIKPRRFSIGNDDYLAFDGYNLFAGTIEGDSRTLFSMDKDKTRYFMQIAPEVYSPVGSMQSCPNDSYFKNRMKMITDESKKEQVNKYLVILADMVGYAKSKQEEITAHKQERAVRESEAKLREILKQEQKHDEARQKFKAGEAIGFGDFENLCVEYGVELPIQTIGSGRKCITWIKHGSMGLRGKGRPDKALLCAARLFDAMNMRTIVGI